MEVRETHTLITWKHLSSHHFVQIKVYWSHAHGTVKYLLANAPQQCSTITSVKNQMPNTKVIKEQVVIKSRRVITTSISIMYIIYSMIDWLVKHSLGYSSSRSWEASILTLYSYRNKNLPVNINQLAQRHGIKSFLVRLCIRQTAKGRIVGVSGGW